MKPITKLKLGLCLVPINDEPISKTYLRVIELAEQHGFSSSLDKHEPEFVNQIANDAIEFLNDSCCPPRTFFGMDQFDQWGVFPWIYWENLTKKKKG